MYGWKKGEKILMVTIALIAFIATIAFIAVLPYLQDADSRYEAGDVVMVGIAFSYIIFPAFTAVIIAACGLAVGAWKGVKFVTNFCAR